MQTSYQCTNCQETISGVRVQCHVCQEVELCLQCFAAGAEMGGHRNNHAYQFHVRNKISNQTENAEFLFL